MTQTMGTGGLPGVYQGLVPAQTRNVHGVWRYQRTVISCQRVAGSVRRSFNESWRLPFWGLRPGLPGVGAGGAS